MIRIVVNQFLYIKYLVGLSADWTTDFKRRRFFKCKVLHTGFIVNLYVKYCQTLVVVFL